MLSSNTLENTLLVEERGKLMSETNTQNNQQNTEPAVQVQQEGNGASTYTPPATQADLDRIIEGRLQRERAKYADYDQLKADSDKLGTVVAERDSLKSQLDEVEKENGLFKQKEQLREWAAEVSKEFGIPSEALRGETKEEMTAHAETLKKYISTSAPFVSGDGRTPSKPAGTSTRDAFAAALDGII